MERDATLGPRFRGDDEGCRVLAQRIETKILGEIGPSEHAIVRDKRYASGECPIR